MMTYQQAISVRTLQLAGVKMLDSVVQEAIEVIRSTHTPTPWPGQKGDEADAVARERERCALLCDDLANLMESGAGDPEPGGRLRQAARNIRNPNHKPMGLDALAAREAVAK